MDSSSQRGGEAGAGLAGSPHQPDTSSLLPAFGHLQPVASGPSATQGLRDIGIQAQRQTEASPVLSPRVLTSGCRHGALQ